MFGFLKKLFGIGAQPVPEGPVIVKLADLENWLSGLQAPLKAKIAEQLSTSKNRISQITSAINEKINALQKAQLMNPNIPDRAKDYMTGNREEYARRVQQYLNEIIIPDNADQLASFLEKHSKDAEEFTKGILRPFQILQEFFSNETKEITSMTADIEREIETLKTAHLQANIEAYVALLADAESLVTKQTLLAGLQKQKTDLEKQKQEAENSIKALNAEEKRLLKDAEREKLQQAISEIQAKLRNHEQKIKDIFNNFEPALRKFHKMATRNVKLVGHYLRDPVGSLIEDLHLDILDIVADIERLLKFDRLPVGDKMEYVLDAMTFLNREHLGKWLAEYGRLSKAERHAQNALDECHASKTLARIQKLGDDTRRNITIIEEKIAQTNKDIARINLSEQKAKLEEKIKEVTGKQVTILL
ncbi:MAG: hypothetical protein QXF14_00370 [Candidatus Woesearchaeota archaeon]